MNKLRRDDAAAAPLPQQIDLYGASKRLYGKSRSDELITAYDMSLKESMAGMTGRAGRLTTGDPRLE